MQHGRSTKGIGNSPLGRLILPPSSGGGGGGGGGGGSGTSGSPHGGSSPITSSLPQLSTWEANMSTYGHYVEPTQGDSGNGSFYYDYARVSQRIGDYLGVGAPWSGRDIDAVDAYTAAWFNPGTHSVPYRLNGGHWNFPHGLYYHWLRGGDRASKADEYFQGYINQEHSTYNTPFPRAEAGETIGWPNKDYWFRQSSSREVAYWIQTYCLAEKRGMGRKQGGPSGDIDYLHRYVEMAANHLRIWKTNDYNNPAETNPRMQSFMVGLTLYALTELVDHMRSIGENENQWWPADGWQTVIHDWPTIPSEWPTVVDAIVDMTTWLFDTATTTGGARMWKADESSFRYADRSFSGGGTGAAPDLNLLILPVYGWVGYETGDATYFTNRGDLIFQGGVTQAFLSEDKVFNQNYLKSIDYVEYRNQFGT